jgi:hypothetical protein
MEYRKPLTFCILLFLQLLFINSYSQCASSLKLTDNGVDASGTGFLQVQSDSKMSYEVELICLGKTYKDISVLEKRVLQGEQSIRFDALKAGLQYAVRAKFEGETRKVCIRKQIEFIDLSMQQK